MKKSRFTEQQIVYAIKQVEVGVPIAELCRKYGISQQTFYRWRKKYGGLAPSELNHRWSLDFVADELVSGRRFRVLTVIDVHSRECLRLKAGFSLTAEIVTGELEAVIADPGVPVALTQDNGTEFTPKHYDAWAFSAGIQLDFIRPGRPVENCYIESFNGKLRDECLKAPSY